MKTKTLFNGIFRIGLALATPSCNTNPSAVDVRKIETGLKPGKLDSELCCLEAIKSESKDPLKQTYVFTATIRDKDTVHRIVFDKRSYNPKTEIYTSKPDFIHSNSNYFCNGERCLNYEQQRTSTFRVRQEDVVVGIEKAVKENLMEVSSKIELVVEE